MCSPELRPPQKKFVKTNFSVATLQTIVPTCMTDVSTPASRSPMFLQVDTSCGRGFPGTPAKGALSAYHNDVPLRSARGDSCAGTSIGTSTSLKQKLSASFEATSMLFSRFLGKLRRRSTAQGCPHTSVAIEGGHRPGGEVGIGEIVEIRLAGWEVVKRSRFSSKIVGSTISVVFAHVMT